MSKVSKIGFVATLLLFLTASAPSAMARQDKILCPLGPQANRTLILFDTISPIVAHDSLAAALAGPIDISLPAGIYNITASSYDLHSTRQPPQNQPQEQFYLRLSNGQTTNRISDLPEDNDSFTEQIDANFTVTSDVTSLTAQHTQYPDPGVPNSIIPVCVAFDDVTPSPSPTPTPTPTPMAQTGQDGPSDEIDCCPGPDLEPESEPSSAPRVAGIQSTASPSPTPSSSSTPAVAGTITTFPSAGFPFKPAALLILSLLTALIIWPAGKKQLRHTPL